MIMSNEEKLAKINNDRKIILNSLKARLNNSNNACNDSLNNIANLFTYEESTYKEYKAIIEAKNLIFELTKEIANSNSIDEIIVIRKKINYYINKIKKILKSRGIFGKQLDILSEKSGYLRKNISSYIRYLKREKNIDNIIELTNKDDLNEEEKNNLKKLFKNELGYNKRNQNLEDKDKEKKEDKLFDYKFSLDTKEDEEDKVIFDYDFSFSKKEEENTIDIPFEILDEKGSEDNNIEFNFKFEADTKDDNLNPVLDNHRNYYLQYDIKKLHSYNGNVISNFYALIRNIPSIIHNKRMIKIMEKDYKYFYRGEDLKLYIENLRDNNSIIKSLKAIFSNSTLSKREDECLNIHNSLLADSCNFTMYDSGLSKEENYIRIRKI